MGFKLAQCGRAVYRRFNSRVLYVSKSGLRPDTAIAAIANPYAAKFHQSFSVNNSYSTAAATPKTKGKAASKKATPAPKRGRPPKSEKEKKAEKRAADKKAEAKEQLKILKMAALTPPKRLPTAKLAVFTTGKGVGIMKLVDEYKQLSEFQLEELQQTCEKNITTNRHNLEQWVESHTPLEIKNANDARRKLRRILSSKSRTYNAIKDDRQVKPPRSAYIFYAADKQKTGALDHLSAKERLSEIARTWNNASESEKEKYGELKEEDRTRYINEYREIYGEEPNLVETSEAEDL
ncbi:hypothetical protein FQN49_003709 [Arthroderma sp. PD_2]|nr:hypothetical protein FQN49_003709 [Arthroderma sp. PD_2]